MQLQGSYVAIVTPFRDGDGTIDYDLLQRLVAAHGEAGTAGIVPCGTTGESPTLSHEEHAEVVRQVIAAAAGARVPVIAGSGSNSTKEAVWLTEQAGALGAQAVLVVTPYYNRPSPDGLVAHFRELDAVGLPMVLYNVPGRTGSNVSPDTLVRIWEECPNLLGLKAANGNLDEITEVAYRTYDPARPFYVLSGDDSLTLPIMAVGGTGVISVAANVIPSFMATLVHSYLAGDTAGARARMYRVHPFGRALLKLGSNPEAVKTVMRRRGIAVGRCRNPLGEIRADAAETVMRLLDQIDTSPIAV
jgi:4-hydroxy-tetrahydrodipicolinate synthase